MMAAGSYILWLALGACLGELAWASIDSAQTLAWLLGMIPLFCLMCAAAVWALRNRVDTDGTEQMTSYEYRYYARRVIKLRARLTYWAALTALMALVAASPVVSAQLAHAIWRWMVIADGAAAGGAAWVCLAALGWEKQLWARRFEQELSAKKLRERQELIAKISASVGLQNGGGAGWKDGPPLKPAAKQEAAGE